MNKQYKYMIICIDKISIKYLKSNIVNVFIYNKF